MICALVMLPFSIPSGIEHAIHRERSNRKENREKCGEVLRGFSSGLTPMRPSGRAKELASRLRSL